MPNDQNPVDFKKVLEDERALIRYGDGQAVGLALSGGGIRSATFSLGVLQALAARRKLSSFDYLSTVSGGGYIGAWLSALIQRTPHQDARRVEDALGASATSSGPEPLSTEPEAVQWLRRYSNYLTPRLGLFSADSLSLISIWLRNVVLILTVVLLALATVLMVPRLLLLLLAGTDGKGVAEWYGWVAIILTVTVIPAAIKIHLSRLSRAAHRPGRFDGPMGVGMTVVGPGIVAAMFGSVWFFNIDHEFPFLTEGMRWTALGGFIAAIAAAKMFMAVQNAAAHDGSPKTTNSVPELLIYVLALAVAIACAVGMLWMLHGTGYFSRGDRRAVLALGPSVFLLVAGLGGWIFVGLVGRIFYERSREWWSSMNAAFFGVAGIILVVNLFAFYVPGWVTALWNVDWVRELTAASWIGSLLLSWLGSRDSHTATRSRFNLMSLASIAAFVGMLGFLALAAWLTDFALARGEEVVTVTGLRYLWLAFGLTALALGIFSWRVDVNKFSLHNMYKNRLIRCYLGASRGSARRPHPFTGFDDLDDFSLHRLAARQDPPRLYHIVNTALNLSQGENLAWQERKSAAFMLTPLYCGFSLSGTQGERKDATARSSFRPTKLYATAKGEDKQGFTLGMAMATSGAAASPNSGVHTRPTLAFMLTLLNARLGRWSPNPALKKWREPSPPFSLFYLLHELFGFSNNESNYVYLSDGGHFENTGIYELVRRRCKVIVVVDAGADAERGFSDLGRAFRQCRIDFGVDITIDLNQLRLSDGGTLAASGVAKGEIDYGDPDRMGALIVIKPTLCADRKEPADVLNYGALNPAFPQQSTADQFFDESQFESYRQLGVYLGGLCLDEYGHLIPGGLNTAPADSVVPAATTSAAGGVLDTLASLAMAVVRRLR